MALLMGGGWAASRFLSGLDIGGSNVTAPQEPPEPAGAVVALRDAYVAGSCDDFVAATTQAYRDQYSLATCDAFTAQKQTLDAAGGFPAVTVISTSLRENQARVVDVREVLGAATTDVEYTVVLVDGTWLVDGRTVLASG
jgi:hypothetical protein